MTLTTEYQLVGSCWQGSSYGANYYQGIYAKYSRTNQQYNDNKSTIYIKVCAWNDQSLSDYNSLGGSWTGTFTGIFNDTWSAIVNVYGGTPEASRVILWAGSVEITHNDDGNYSTTIGAINVDSPIPNSVSTSIQSTTLTLPQIPRAASLNFDPPFVYVGNTLYTTNSPYVSNFTYSLIAYRGDTKLTIYDKKSYADYSFDTLTAGFYQLFQPGETRCVANLCLNTYNGNQIIGFNTKPISLYANSNHYPTVTISSEDTGKSVLNSKTTKDLTGNGKRIISGWNAIQTTWSATANSGGNITNVLIYDEAVSTSPISYNNITSIPTIVATDSYGLSTTMVEDDLTFIPYDSPSIVPTIKRNTATDGHVNLTFVGTFYNTDFGKETNNLLIDWYVKEKSSANYTKGTTSLSYTINNDNTSYKSASTISLANPLQSDGLFDYAKSYLFKFIVYDKVTTYEIENIVLTKGIPNFVVFKDTVMANGKRIDPVGLLDLMHPVGEVFTTTNSNFDPNTAWGGTWEKLSADAYLKIVTSSAGITNGTNAQHKIPVSSMPSHTHTFTGSAVTTDTKGAHTHPVYNDNNSGSYDGMYIVGKTTTGTQTYMLSAGNHFHTVTAKGTNSETGDGNAYYPYYYGVYAWHRTA